MDEIHLDLFWSHEGTRNETNILGQNEDDELAKWSCKNVEKNEEREQPLGTIAQSMKC